MTQPSRPNNLIVKMQFGSHLYGTNTADSDTDYKAVFMPKVRDLLLGRAPRSLHFDTKQDQAQKNGPHDVDVEYLSLHHFIKKAATGEMVTMDMLHAPIDMCDFWTPVWEEIISHREKFYTKNLAGLANYCKKQAYKYGVKGSTVNAQRLVIGFLSKQDQSAKLETVWDRLPTGSYIDLGNFFYTVCGKKYQRTLKIGMAMANIQKQYDTCGHRAILAAKNEGINWKACSHAIRAAGQVKEILTDRTVTFPRSNADYLTAVKTGKLDFNTEVQPTLEGLIDEVQALATESTLPDQVDMVFWDDFIEETARKFL